MLIELFKWLREKVEFSIFCEIIGEPILIEVLGVGALVEHEHWSETDGPIYRIKQESINLLTP
jgi:hypothetical protein